MLLRTSLLKDLDDEAIERAVNVNLYGTIHVVKAFLSHLLERPTAYPASVPVRGGYLPVAGQTIYGATKAAVKLMTEGLYAEPVVPTSAWLAVVSIPALSFLWESRITVRAAQGYAEGIAHAIRVHRLLHPFRSVWWGNAGDATLSSTR